jgi:hypothetical protein
VGRLVRVGAALLLGERVSHYLLMPWRRKMKNGPNEHKHEGGNGIARKGKQSKAKSNNLMFNLPSGELGGVGRVNDDSSRGLYSRRTYGRDADGDLLLLGATLFVIVGWFPSDGSTFSPFQLLPRTSGVLLLLLLLFAIVDASGTGRFASLFTIRLHEQTLLVLMVSIVVHCGKTADVSTASTGNR